MSPLLVIMIACFAGYVTGVISERFAASSQDSCPEEILGYSCKSETGKTCDHSKVAVLEAKLSREIERNRQELLND